MHGYCMLSNGSNDVRTVGIRGIGRPGTPVAKAIYNKIANQFESSFFLANVREMSKQNRAVEQQETLLSQIQERKFIAGNLYPGIDAIRDRLCTKKVLIDIDDIFQTLISRFRLKSLATLLLTAYEKLEAFPDIVEEMPCFEKVGQIEDTYIVFHELLAIPLDQVHACSYKIPDTA
ncbi:hypothetical protein POTOM_057869 [Populus tomentosa]|uniref:NB-ARC domain-containing protein n=1 Tax=Populus tomentosa TaxID=118781 RepID=A0A8X8C2E4_POPTO|nr:hypothetical protein POTOM_057869 [Populus tomentosa]